MRGLPKLFLLALVGLVSFAPPLVSQGALDKWNSLRQTQIEQAIEAITPQPSDSGGDQAQDILSVPVNDAIEAYLNLLSRRGVPSPASETAPLFQLEAAERNIERLSNRQLDTFVVGQTAVRTDRFRDVVLLMKASVPYLRGTTRDPPTFPDHIPRINATGPICSGVFVSDTTVLTAAHCVCALQTDIEAERALTVVMWGSDIRNLGDNDLYFGDQPSFSALSKTKTPKTLNPRFCDIYRATGQVVGPDVALMYLDEEVADILQKTRFKPTYRPAIFAWPDLYLSSDAFYATVVGYGISELQGKGLFGLKVTAEIPVADMICGQAFSQRNFGCRIGEEIILIDQIFGNDTCNGDSGGPAYLRYYGRYYLVGITSRAAIPNANNCGRGGIYTLLTPRILTWVRQNTITLDPTF